MNMGQAVKISSFAILCVSLSACSTVYNPHNDSHRYAPPVAKSWMPPKKNNGSIYQASHSILLYEDEKARNVGDIITVVLNESTTGTKAADTTTDKNDSATIANPTILGSLTQFSTPNFIPLVSNDNNSLATNISADRSFAGSGASNQNNTLTGTISVTVVNVLPNGNMAIRGEKWIGINRGDEYIRLTGIVRPRDITPQNTVLSTRIADARITYSGSGEVAESNVKGWLSRFFSSPYWPI